MSCGSHHGQCGLTYEQALTYFETYISNALLCGKLQGGISACDSETILPAGSAVVTCEQLQKKVNELLANGELNIPGIESLEFDGERLTLVDQTGQSWQVDLKGLADRTVENLQMLKDGSLALTLKDGTIFKIPLQEYLADLVKDAGIKSGTLDQDGNLVLSLGNGDQITVNMDALKKVYVERDGPLTGDGTKDNPLDVDFSRVCWQVIESMHFTEEGLVIQIANQCDPVVLPLDEILTVLNSRVKVCVDSEQGIITGNGATGECLSLDLDKLVSLMVKNDTLINNIANALHYKIKVAVTQGVTGDGTKDNPLNVKLSPDSGNLLTLRDNGLYYGTQAAADVTNLYVDPVAGDDANPGTRVLPLKTLDTAVGKVRTNQSNNVWLRAGQTFYFKNTITVDGGATRQFLSYGDPYIDGDLKPADVGTVTVPHYYGYILENANRPIIKPWIYYNEATHIFSCSVFNPRNGGQISLIGCTLDPKPINDVDTGHASVPETYDNTWNRYNSAMAYGNSAGVLELRGCVVKIPLCPENTYEYARKGSTAQEDLWWWGLASSGADGAMASVMLNHCKWEEGGGSGILAMGAASSQLYATGWPSNPVAVNERDGYQMLTENMTSRLKETNAVRSVVRDSNGVPRNVSSNVVL